MKLKLHRVSQRKRNFRLCVKKTMPKFVILDRDGVINYDSDEYFSPYFSVLFRIDKIKGFSG